jgi:hypothetical protein
MRCWHPFWAPACGASWAPVPFAAIVPCVYYARRAAATANRRPPWMPEDAVCGAPRRALLVCLLREARGRGRSAASAESAVISGTRCRRALAAPAVS